MSNECCKELSGWCVSFTRVERALVVLEAALLALFLALFVFVTLHMIICSSPMTYIVDNTVITSPTEGAHTHSETVTSATTTKSDKYYTTKDPKIKCTWEPSVKTEAGTHYYYKDGDKQMTIATATYVSPMSPYTTPTSDEYYLEPESVNLTLDEFEHSDVSDGEEVNDEKKSFVIALVKMRPPTDITFGCILTIISEYWVVTAASCIEAIEELDSLDSFLMMEEYGSDKSGQIHTISDLQVHPYYQETNRSYDIAALRSDDSLLRRDKRPVPVVSSLEDALLVIGERFHLLGYGAFRSMESGAGGRRLREAYVYSVAARLCESPGEGRGALRHLAGGRRAGPGPAPAARRLCAGVLSARGLPCNYCGGAPLLSAEGRLLALMMESPQCGLACEPNLYLPIVLVLDWIERLLSQ